MSSILTLPTFASRFIENSLLDGRLLGIYVGQFYSHTPGTESTIPAQYALFPVWFQQCLVVLINWSEPWNSLYYLRKFECKSSAIGIMAVDENSEQRRGKSKKHCVKLITYDGFYILHSAASVIHQDSGASCEFGASIITLPWGNIRVNTSIFLVVKQKQTYSSNQI